MSGVGLERGSRTTKSTEGTVSAGKGILMHIEREADPDKTENKRPVYVQSGSNNKRQKLGPMDVQEAS